MLHAFKIKPFDLEPVYTTWTDAPRFNGKENKDLTVSSWLAKIEEGCKLHGIPKDLWPEVAQHYMGEKAVKRFKKIAEVMTQMHGSNYTWTWKRFKTAMENSHWELEGSKWLRFVGAKAASVFTKGDQAANKDKSTKTLGAPCESKSLLQRTSTKSDQATNKDKSSKTPVAPSETKSLLQRTLTKSDKSATGSSKDLPRPKQPQRASSMFLFSSGTPSSSTKGPAPTNTLKKEPPKEKAVVRRSNSLPKASTTVVDGSGVEVPVWLLLACEALKDLNVEYPTTMGVISAILITVGSIPALPAVSAGAAGTFLASGTAHAIGSIAVGLGGLLTAHQQANKP